LPAQRKSKEQHVQIEYLSRILQASIGPSIFISGAGLLLLSMTNRLGRSIDRIRTLIKELENIPEKEFAPLELQIRILYRRCHLLRSAIGLATASIFFLCLIMLLLFSAFLLDAPLEHAVEILFAAGVISLLLSLVFFLMDIRLTLNSLRIEIEGHLHE
jgi:hypothetical protein